MNARVISYSSFHLWNIAADAAQRACDVKKAYPKACTADTMTAILLSVMSTEAFINELGVSLFLGKELCVPGLERWLAVATLLDLLENEKDQIRTKYLKASQILPGCPLTKGGAPFQDFSTLIDIRNDIVHPKPLEKEPKYIKDFCQKGLMYNKASDYPKLSGWLYQMETPAMAKWACRAAHDLITNFVERFSSDQHPFIAELHTNMNFQWSKVSDDIRLK